jgi:hypothetical protein
VSTHALSEHSSPAGQATPHEPQFWLLVCKLTHVPPQFVRPIWHDTAHVPAEHTSPAGHALPHVPQFPTSVFVFVHVPPQFVCPA